MTRALRLTALVAMGIFMAASLVSAQDAPASTSGGQITIGALGVTNVASSKFTEYREVPKGPFVPYVNLFSTGGTFDFKLFGYNVSQRDQQYLGSLNSAWFGLTVDYNQIPHDMGNNAQLILHEVSEGVWAMSETLRRTLQTTIDATPTAARTVLFYDNLLGPTFAATNRININADRKRGTATLDLGGSSPFALSFTYMRELKTGYRGDGGGGEYSAISSVVEVPEPLNDITQDFGVKAAYNFKKGNIHAALLRNIYNNRAEVLVADNPFQAFDAPYVTTPAPAVGGPSRGRWIMAPDNEATTGNVGFLLKFAKQTRMSGDLSLAAWTQNAPYYPYTINSTILTPAGVRADSLAALPQKSLDGKINTTTVNLMFSSRPATGLGLRVGYRVYDLSNKTTRFDITGDVAGSPDRVWGVVTGGHATNTNYDSKTERFTAAASYDIAALTLEGQFRHAKLTRTNREAESGKDTGYAFSALFHAAEWLGFRGTFDQAKRTAEGHTVYGFQSDEAERETQRVGVDIEINPHPMFDVTFAYFLRDVTFPNRPDRVQVVSGAPAPGASPIPGTPSGLLSAKYDSYTAEIGFRPSSRAEFTGFYTYEKDRTTNQWATTTGVNLNNLMRYDGSDKTDSFGVNAMIQLVPEKWTFDVNAIHQKVDGFMDITANPTGAFYTGRVTAGVPGVVRDITDLDDTKITTLNAQLKYAMSKQWELGVGGFYEKFDYADEYTDGNLLMPQAILIFMKPNFGNYDAKGVYAKLNYRF